MFSCLGCLTPARGSSKSRFPYNTVLKGTGRGGAAAGAIASFAWARGVIELRRALRIRLIHGIAESDCHSGRISGAGAMQDDQVGHERGRVVVHGAHL